jgi:hypothetical protein
MQLEYAVQALRRDSAKWDAMLRGAGSPAHIARMHDSTHGSGQWSLGDKGGHFLAYHAFDFWLNLALCHALLVDVSDGKASYQARCCVLVRCKRFGWAWQRNVIFL